MFLEEINDNYPKDFLICDHISGATSINVEAISGLIRKYQPDICILDGIYLVEVSSSKNRNAAMLDENEVENPKKRRVQVQKIRDSQMFIDSMWLDFDVNSGIIKEDMNYDPFIKF